MFSKLSGRLSGHALRWWDASYKLDGDYDDIIWDLTINKKLLLIKKIESKIFFSVYNIFSGTQFVGAQIMEHFVQLPRTPSNLDKWNTDTWIEAGMSFSF